MVVVDEQELIFDAQKYNVATAESVGKLDIIYSYFNHRQLWMELHEGFWALRNIGKEYARLARWWWQHKFGYRSTEDLAKLKGKFSGPVIVCGSGPTLDDALPRLKDWKGAVICATSQAPTLVYHGVHPDFIEAIDPRIEDWEIKAPWDYKKTRFIGCPTIRPAMFDRWAGRKYLFRTFEPNVELYGKILPFAYIDVTAYTYPFGAVIPLMITHAHFLGFGPIFLVGCDFGYPGEKCTFAHYNYLGRGRWRKEPNQTLAERMEACRVEDEKGPTNNVFVKTRNGTMSEMLHVHYRNQVLRVMAFDLCEVFCVPGGIITAEQMPYISLDQLLDWQGRVPEDWHRTPEQILRAVTKELMKIGIYVVEHGAGGRSMASLKNWHRELKLVIDVMNKQGGTIDYGREQRKFADLQREINEERANESADDTSHPEHDLPR